MARRTDISGQWTGSYSYPAGSGPTTPFLATIDDAGGALAGTIVEPNLQGRLGDTAQAFLRGTRHGSTIDFTKVYDGAGDFAHAVDYVGQLSADGAVISGVWSLADMDGSFEMRRDEGVEEEAGAEGERVTAS